jgi:DNA-binding Xre family transcriptional regulator
MATRLKVKEIAEARGMSQRQLFFRSQVDLKTIQRMYRYPTATVITTDTLDKLARALHVDASLLVESDPPLPKVIEGDQVEERDDAVDENEGQIEPHG